MIKMLSKGFTVVEVLVSLTIIATLFCLIILPSFKGCKVNPEQTYRVYNITDSSGKTYYNLNHIYGNTYFDQQHKEYIFNGNHTVISSTISGYDILKLRTEKE